MQTVVKFLSRLGLFLILCPALLSAAESHRYCRQIRWEMDLTISCRFEISADKAKEANAYHLVYNDKGRLIRWEYLRAGQKAIENHLVPSQRVFEYNAQGYEISNLNYQGQPAKDSGGIYSYLVTRDPKKHLATIAYYDQYGKLKNSPEGCAQLTFITDDNGRAKNLSCHSAGRAQAPSHASDKVLFRYDQLTYDAQGNVVEERITDENGVLVENLSGVAIYKYKVDPVGNIIEAAFFGSDGELVGSPSLHPESIVSLADSQIPEVIAPDSAKVTLKYDEFGQMTELRNFGNMGQKIAASAGKYRYHMVRFKYDSRGNLIEIDGYGVDDKLLKSSTTKMSAVQKMKYDELGNLVEHGYFNDKGKPIKDKDDKASVIKMKYDARRNLVEVSYFGPDGKPVAGILGSAVVRYVYDDGDRRIEERFFDKEGKPAEAGDGKAAIIKHKYDQWNQIAETSYFGKGDQLKLHKKMKIATVKMVLDYQGHVLEKRFFGKDGKPKNYRQHAVEKCEYDDIGTMTERKYYNTNGREITWIY